jgi:hypothetical protein
VLQGRVHDVQVRVAAEVGEHGRGAGVAGVGDRAVRGGQPDPRVRHVVGQRHALHLERSDAVGAGQRVHVEQLGETGFRFERVDQLGHTGRAQQRDLLERALAVVPHPQQGVQVDAVVAVLVGDHDGVDRAVRTVGEQPGQCAEPEVEHQPETGVLHQEPGARASRLRPRGAAPEHSDLHGPRLMCRMGFFGQFHFDGTAWTAPRDDAVPPWLSVDIHDSDIATITYEPAGPGTGIAFLGETPRTYFEDDTASEPTDVAREAAGLAEWWSGINDMADVWDKERELVGYLAEDGDKAQAATDDDLDDLDEIADEDIFVEVKVARFLDALDLPVPDDLVR